MYPILNLINITTISVVVAFIGAAGIILLSKPIDKAIMFGLLQGGFIGLVVAAKYLDVAMVAAILDPVSTVIMLIAIIKLDEIRKRRQKSLEEEVIA
jgi:energy-converting hydrogenase A subunit D